MREIIDYIYGIPKFSKKCSLDNTKEMLKRLGNPSIDKKIIHVAGTNGKGSTCTYLEGILKSAGKKVGVFTSPHLIRMNERIRINGMDVSDSAFVESFMKVKDVAVKMAEDGFVHPSFFEFLFGMAMDIFSKADLEYIILETGLGGRLDATNVIEKPELCIITSISKDHTDILGDTYEAIAMEKAGIIKENVPVLFGNYLEEVANVIKKTAEDKNAPMFSCKTEDVSDVVKSDKYIDFSLCNRYYGNERFSIKSKGIYQTQNAALAITAAGILGIDSVENVKKGLLEARWMGRMQEIDTNMILDGAHNEDGMSRFLESVAKESVPGGKHLMFSAVRDKHYPEMIKMICDSGLFDGYIIVPINDERGLEVEAIEKEFLKHTNCPISTMENLSQGIFEACMLRDEGNVIYIAGSLYLAGEILEMRV